MSDWLDKRETTDCLGEREVVDEWCKGLRVR